MPKTKERGLFPSAWTLERCRRHAVYGKIWERSPELFCVLYHVFPCTSIALLLLWPSSSIPFLKVMPALSAFVLLLQVINFFCRLSTSLINFLVFECLHQRQNLYFLNLKEWQLSITGTNEFSPRLCTILAFPMEISCLTHKNAFVCITLVACSHPVIYSCLQEHLPTLTFPNWSRNSPLTLCYLFLPCSFSCMLYWCRGHLFYQGFNQ